MSDETTGIYQPGEATEQPTPAPDNQPKEYVTPDQLDAKLAKFYQDVQSMTAKQVNVVANKLSKWEADAKAAGKTVTPELLKAKEQQLTIEALDDEIEGVQPGPYPAKAPTGNPITQKVIEETNAAKDALYKKYDYVLTENDPEYWQVPWTGSTPEDFLKSLEDNLKVVAPRRGRQLPQEVQPGNPAARIGGPTGSSPVGADAIAEELDRLQNKPSRTPAEENRRKQLEGELLKLIQRR